MASTPIPYKDIILIFFFRYNHLVFTDAREPLVEISLQLLIVVLDYDMEQQHMIEQAHSADQDFEVEKLSISCEYHLEKLSSLIKKLSKIEAARRGLMTPSWLYVV